MARWVLFISVCSPKLRQTTQKLRIFGFFDKRHTVWFYLCEVREVSSQDKCLESLYSGGLDFRWRNKFHQIEKYHWQAY